MPLNDTTGLGLNNELTITPDGVETSVNIGSVPAAIADYVVATEYGDGTFHRTVLTVTGLVVSTVDNGTAGHAGAVQVYDFPKGYVRIEGGVMKWTNMVVDGTGLPNNSEIDIGIGSTAAGTDMVSLSGTTQDIVTKDDITFSTLTAATNQTQGNVTVAALDGSATAKDAYINVAASAATGTADGTLTLTGTVVIDWTNLGYAGE
jgi:hypothetical protein